MTDINRVCIFAHYDKDNIVDEYVYYYLHELLKVVGKIVFVTVSDIKNKDIECLEAMNVDIIKRENIGYDFYSYKVGLESINLEQYDELIICNHSVFGPLYPLQNIFNTMENEKCDFWGITDSKIMFYHIQSYFIVFKKNIMHSSEFIDFFSLVSILENKEAIIEQYEIGLSRKLIQLGFQPSVYVNYKVNAQDNTLELGYRVLKNPLKLFKLLLTPTYYLSIAISDKGNASVSFWEKLVTQYKMPFFKKSLIMEFDGGQKRIAKLKSISNRKELKINYPVSLIEKYLINRKQGNISNVN